MDTRLKRAWTLLAAVAALVSPTPAAETGKAEKMNVLFIISDDCRTELSCYASKLAKTPNLDKLSSQGVRFDRAYCQFPLCNPSRASMLTGRNPTVTGVMGNRTDFRKEHPDWVTLPQLFKQNGYVSLRTGKIFHGGIDDLASWTEGGDTKRLAGIEGDPDDATPPAKNDAPAGDDKQPKLTAAQKSDRIIVLEGNGESHGDYKVADRAIEFLKDNKDKPFFIGCGFVKPHSPPTAPRRFFDLWDVNQIPLPKDFAPRPTVPEGFPAASIRPKNTDPCLPCLHRVDGLERRSGAG
jgi:iduronate 2-sulfatase